MTPECLQLAMTLIKRFEGCELTAYKCPRGRWTIGWGHTGPEVCEGLVWTQGRATEAFALDIGSVDRQIDRIVHRPLTDNERAALISFVFNVGCGEFFKSTMLVKLNDGSDPQDIAHEFNRWVHCNGVELTGLRDRREAEAQLFLEVSQPRKEEKSAGNYPDVY